MELAALETTLIAAVHTAAAETSTTLSVYWADGPQRMRKPRSVRLAPVSVVSFGTDERRSAEVGDQLQERIYGFRRLTVQIDVDTDKQSLDLTALALVDDIRTGLMRRDVLETLSAIGFGLAEIKTIGSVPYPSAHGRTRSATVLEIVLNTSTTSQGVLVDWIAAVSWDATITDADGSVVLSETITVGTPDP